MKTLVILRGLPGAGKSKVAALFLAQNPVICCADDYLYDDGQYKFDKYRITDAHRKCQFKAEKAMELNEPLVIINNTSTTELELAPYLDMAKRHHYEVHSLIVENRHNNVSEHNVPVPILKKMYKRFSVKLIDHSLIH